MKKARPSVKKSVLVLLLIVGVGLGNFVSPAKGEDLVLWPVPKAGDFLFSVGSGAAVGSKIDGMLVDLRGSFFFDYIFLSLTGSGTFIDEGVIYSIGFDLNGYLGPFYAGVGASMGWLPGGSSGNTPILSFQTGVRVITFWDNGWLDLSYRPNIAFMSGDEVVYHMIIVGLDFRIK
jgi:hypothetical protein